MWACVSVCVWRYSNKLLIIFIIIFVVYCVLLRLCFLCMKIEIHFYLTNDNYKFQLFLHFWPDNEEANFYNWYKTKEKCIEIIYFITNLLGNTQWLNRIYGLLFMILNAFFGMQNYIRDMVNHNFITYNGRNCILGFAWTKCHLQSINY